MSKKSLDELMARQREVNEKLGGINTTLQQRELNDEEKASQAALLAEYETNKREIALSIQEKQAAAIAVKPKKDMNTELHEFNREAKPG